MRWRIRQGWYVEPCLYNPCTLLPAPQDVRLVRDVVRASDSLRFGEKATPQGHNHEIREKKPNELACAVHEVKLATMVIHDLGDYWVAPQPVDRQGKLLGKAKVGIDGKQVQLTARNLRCGCLWYWPLC